MSIEFEMKIDLSIEDFIRLWALLGCQVEHQHDVETCIPYNITLGEN